MKIGIINSITNGTFNEQNGSNNTMNINKEDHTITYDTFNDDMFIFLENLCKSDDIIDTEKSIIAEAKECVHNNDRTGLIDKLKKLSGKTLEIIKGISESIAGSILFEWFKSNGII